MTAEEIEGIVSQDGAEKEPGGKDKQIERLMRRIEITEKVVLEHTEKFLIFEEIGEELEKMRADLLGPWWKWRGKNYNTRYHLVKIGELLSRISQSPRYIVSPWKAPPLL